jgi:mannose-6-phosphate isomerase-like protein (cupin superfamily)
MAKIQNIDEQAINNQYFRHVLATGKHSQIVIMSINPGNDIGEETHKDNDQILYLAAGSGQSVIDGQSTDFNMGDMILVPAGTKHNFICGGTESMKLITIYSPAHHPEGTIHKTKQDAQKAEKMVPSIAAITASTFQSL